jgi:hypothetical protein
MHPAYPNKETNHETCGRHRKNETNYENDAKKEGAARATGSPGKETNCAEYSGSHPKGNSKPKTPVMPGSCPKIEWDISWSQQKQIGGAN